jgi:two-component sensor histidine kinase
MWRDMTPSSPTDQPVVERTPDDDDRISLTERSLRLRIRQQEILSDLGVLALKGTPFADLLDHAARLTAEGLQADYSKVLEYMPAENRLLVRAGVGWDEGVVGSASVGADLASPAGFALHTGKPVISNHLENDQRFRTPELLVEHGIRRAMNVILQGAANILGMAIEQQLSNGRLKAALERHRVLLKEINHRVKNSLQVVAAMLRLQSSASGDAELRAALAEASSRVFTVGRAYERLAYNADFETIELVAYIGEVCADLEKEILPSRLQLEAPEAIEFTADRAILVALIINELVLNAARHAYPDRPGETIWVSIARAEPNMLLASVRDEGVGLPADFDPQKSKRLGALLVTSLSKQLNAEMTRPSSTTGTNVTLRIPMGGR